MVSVFQIWVNYNFVGSNPRLVRPPGIKQSPLTLMSSACFLYSSNYKDRQQSTIEAVSDITLLVLHITSLTRGGEFLVLGAKPKVDDHHCSYHTRARTARQRSRKDCLGKGSKKNRFFLGYSPKQRTPPTHPYGLGLT